jgi:large subunit ribosomal protein L25
MSESIEVKIRETRGKRNARRLRRAGQIPAILYGHGKESVSLSVPGHGLQSAVRHGVRVIDLRGDLNEPAFVRDVQWDTFGQEMLHVDLTRVVAGETVETDVAVELRGEAPGIKMGGIVELVAHQVTLDCPIRSIPEKLSININALELGQAVTALELQLPEGAQLVTPPETVIVQCIEPVVVEGEEEEAEAAAGEVEPEVIGGRKEDSEED